MKSKYVEKAKSYYMDLYSFIIFIKTEGIYVDTAKDVETSSYTWNFDLERP